MVPLGSSTMALLARARQTPQIADAAFALLLAVVGVVGLVVELTPVPANGPDALAFALALVAAAPYVALHRAPLAVMAASAAVVLVQISRGYSAGLPALALFVAAYGVAAWRGRLQWLSAAGLTIVVLGLIGLMQPGYVTSGQLWINLVLFGMALAAGGWSRARRLHADSLEEQAQLAMRERDEAARRAVAEERVRIAEELHDIVAHSMGVIALQAGVGAHVIDSQPEEAKQALVEISRASRETLREIRRILGVLRGPDGAVYAPAPGLADLDVLVERVRATGVHVDVERCDIADLPGGLDLTAYRVVQEALTNVMKHADATGVQVLLTRFPDRLVLEVTDDGSLRSTAGGGSGHGLLGMRERVAMWGGTLQAGPRQSGQGFAVRAVLPLDPPVPPVRGSHTSSRDAQGVPS